ncbi:hypothetical protein COCCADRAFT_113353, partial [Bipolaris zeicola 26-R-13]
IDKYDHLTSMAWQANINITPCTSMVAMIEYIVKYAAKRGKGDDVVLRNGTNRYPDGQRCSAILPS